MLSSVAVWSSSEGAPFDKRFTAKKYESSSSEEASLTNGHRPPLRTTNHICLPSTPINRNKGRKSPFISGKEDFEHKYDDSDEMFNAVPNKILLTDIDNKKHIDKFFSQFGDPYAKLPIPKTPRALPSPDTILLSPKTPSENSCYVPNEIRSARRKALEEGHTEFRRILQKHGVDPDEHFSKVFSSRKKSSKKVNFECSTPKPDYSDISASNTPLVRYSQIDTPLSGIKQLSEGNHSILSPFNLNLTLSPLPPARSDAYNETLYPSNISPETKSAILKGIVCYVDVRSEKVNKLESVKEELLSLGATVEKNFTKKVTHVVFKEGRVSTYAKAKKEGIPIVGILWIEGCKLLRGVADPALHRPSCMEKYDELMPFQLIKKRRLALLNPNSRVRKNLLMVCDEIPLTPTSIRKPRSRRAITETKGVSKRRKGNTSEEQKFGKKLFDLRNDDKENNLEETESFDVNVRNIQPLDYSSTDNSAEIKLAAIKKRKSAPGKLLSKKNARREDIKAYLLQEAKQAEEEMIAIDREVEELKSQRSNDLGSQATQKKKRKLFDPSEMFINSQISDGSSSAHEEVAPVIIEKQDIPPTPKRARTKATQPAKSLKISIAKKLHRKKQLEAAEDVSSPSGLLFVERSPGMVPKKKQHPPTITLTSVPRDQIPEYVKIIEKLGKFKVVDKVVKTTTHVVSKGPRRTINVIKGIARGCWLLDLEWLTESNANGKWLPEEDFDLSSHFPAALDCCKERRGLKSTRVVDVFKSSGQIYVSRKSVPPYKDLEELLRLCSAKLTSDPEAADIQVGKNGDSSTSGTIVSEKWVLDSITRNTLLPLDDYIEE